MPVHSLIRWDGRQPMTHNPLSGKRSRNLLKWETNSMKTTLFVLCFFCATAAFAQNIGNGAMLSAEPVFIQFTSHTGHASQQPMGTEQNLLGQSGFSSAHGERPLWEVASPAP